MHIVKFLISLVIILFVFYFFVNRLFYTKVDDKVQKGEILPIDLKDKNETKNEVFNEIDLEKDSDKK